MDSENPGSVQDAGHGVQRSDELFLGRGDEGRQVRGDAGREERCARAPVPVRVGAEEVDADDAVDLEVYEPWNGQPAPMWPLKPYPAMRPSAISRSPGTRRPSTSAAFDSELHRRVTGRIMESAGRLGYTRLATRGGAVR